MATSRFDRMAAIAWLVTVFRERSQEQGCLGSSSRYRSSRFGGI